MHVDRHFKPPPHATDVDQIDFSGLSSLTPYALFVSCLLHVPAPCKVIPGVDLPRAVVRAATLKYKFFFFCVPSYTSRGSPLFLCFCVPIYISGVHHHSSASAFPVISLGFTISLLLLCSNLYLWGSPLFFCFCVPIYISGVHQYSSSSAFPVISLGFTFLLLLMLSQLYLWIFFFFFFFCVPSYISGVHH